MNNVDPKRVVTGRCRLSYVHLTTPRAQEQGGKLKYSVTLLIPKADVATRQRLDAAVNATILEAVSSRWGGVRPPQPAIPIWDGDGLRSTGEPFGDECKGHWVLTASGEQKPEVVDVNLNPIVNATEIYSGMFGRASIRFFGYNSNGKKGIGCGLNNVQKLEDGEPLGGRTLAVDDFGQAPGYAPPAYPAAPAAAPAYNPAMAPGYPAQPYQAPGYPQPGYAPAPQPGYAPVQQPVPGYPQQPVTMIDPITGMPVVPIMGLNQ